MEIPTKHKKVSSIEEAGYDNKRQNPWFAIIAFICITFAVYMTITEAQPAPVPVPVAPGNDSQTEEKPKAHTVSGDGVQGNQRDNSKSILIVEDNPVVLFMTVLNIIKDCPECEVMVCCTPRDAIAAISLKQWYRIVLDDDICPDEAFSMIGGRVVLEYIKSNFPHQLNRVAVNSVKSDFQTLALTYGCRVVAKGGW